jgi:hypothetical protein
MNIFLIRTEMAGLRKVGPSEGKNNQRAKAYTQDMLTEIGGG